jgi:hypothetical protein
VIAENLVIAGQAEYVSDSQAIGTQQVALDGYAVAVPAGHLENRLQSVMVNMQTGRQTGHPYHRGLTVGDISGVNIIFQQAGIGNYPFRGSVLGRTYFSGKRQPSAFQSLLKLAAGIFH